MALLPKPHPPPYACHYFLAPPLAKLEMASLHKAKAMARDSSLNANAKVKDSSRKAKAKAKDLQKMTKAKAKDLTFVLKDNHGPRPRTNITVIK